MSTCSNCSRSTDSSPCPRCQNEQFCDFCNQCNICGPKPADPQAALTKYQEASLSLWSRSQMVDFLMREGQRGPRRALRGKPLEWLMRECVIEGALLCNECGDETTEANPMIDTGRCQQCEVKAEESEHDESLCDCPCHD